MLVMVTTWYCTVLGLLMKGWVLYTIQAVLVLYYTMQDYVCQVSAYRLTQITHSVRVRGRYYVVLYFCVLYYVVLYYSVL